MFEDTGREGSVEEVQRVEWQFGDDGALGPIDDLQRDQGW